MSPVCFQSSLWSTFIALHIVTVGVVPAWLLEYELQVVTNLSITRTYMVPDKVAPSLWSEWLNELLPGKRLSS